jgi:predicted Zn-dependent peptidase
VNFSLKGLLKLLYNTPPPPPPAEDPKTLADRFNNLARGTFESGLYAETKGVPADVIKMRIDVKTGSSADPLGLEGLAHVTEHMAFYGSRETQRLMREFEARGGYANAGTREDVTTYEFSVPNAGDNETFLYQLASRIVLNHEMEPDQLEKEKEPLTAEVARRGYAMKDNPLVELVRQSFGLDMPDHLQTGGTPETFAKISIDDVRAFREKYYIPSNMKLMLSGVAGDSAYRGLKESFGAPPRLPPPDQSGKRKAVYQGGYRHLEGETGAQTYVGVSFSSPSEISYAQLGVMDNYLTAALQRRLRGPDDRPVYDFDAYRHRFRDQVITCVMTNARTDRAGTILPAIAETMKDLAAGKVDPVLLTTALAQGKRSLAEAKESSDYSPRETENAYERQEQYDRDRKIVDSTTAEDLSALARRMLEHPPTLVTKGDVSHVQSYDQFVSMLDTVSPAPQQAPVLAAT